MQVKPISKGVKLAVLLASILTGVLFCILGIQMFNILFTIIGGLLVVGGIFAIVAKNFVAGVLIAAIGVLIILGCWIPNWINVTYIVFGVLMVISGVLGFFVSVIKEDPRSCVSSVISAVLGGFLIGFRQGADWMVFVIGALFILLGLVGLILVLIPNKKDKKDKKVVTVDVKEVK